jgi:SAM-dependent methyltransferase
MSGNTILELACGTGRLANSLVREGADYTGLELSQDFADLAKKKLNQYGNTPTIVTGDMRNFQLNKTFDLIFIGFNSFLHLLTDEDAASFFTCVKKHMHENSRFLIDIFIPNPLFLYRPEGIQFPVLEYNDSHSDKIVKVQESNIYNADTEVNELTWYFSFDDQKDFAIEQFSMRMYFPSKMNQILIENGFRILHQWGDYYRSPLGEGSKLQIYDVCIA